MNKIVLGIVVLLLIAPMSLAGQASGHTPAPATAIEKVRGCEGSDAKKADCASGESRQGTTPADRDEENLGGKMMLYVTLMILGACAFVWLLFV